MIEIPCAEAPLVMVEAQGDLSLLENRAVLVAEHGEERASLEVGPNGIPVDIEIAGERRISSPLENIVPPRIVTANGHVVRDEIEDQSHTVRVQRVDERAEIRLAADFRVQPVMIDDVVAVGLAGACRRNR